MAFVFLLFSISLSKRRLFDNPEEFLNYTREEERKPIRVFFDTSGIKTDKYFCSENGQNIQLVELDDFDNDTVIPYTCHKEDILSENNIEIFNQTLQNVQSYLSRLLKVNRINGTLNITKMNNNDPDPQNSTFDADLYIQVVSRPDENDAGKSIMRSCAGQYRATHGFISVRPSEIRKVSHPQNETVISDRELFTTILHEVFHLLGLKRELMPYWNIPNATQTYHDNNSIEFIKNYTNPDYPYKTITYLVTPNAKNFAKSRFNISQLPDDTNDTFGIELEDADQNDHVETRVYFNDIMNPTSSGDLRISDVTLAMLMDTNYYDVNTSMSEPLSWGDKSSLGDSSINSSFAIDSPQKYFPSHYICTEEEVQNALNDSEYRVCSHDFESLSQCLSNKSTISCPSTDDTEQYYCESKDFYNPNNVTNFPIDRYYDFTSFKTFISSCRANNKKCARVQATSDDVFHGECVDVACADNKQSYSITIGGETKQCTKKDEIISIGNYSVKCENPLHYCSIDSYEKNFKSFFSSSSSDPSSSDGLSDGAIAGIVVACTAFATIATGASVYGVKKHKKQQNEQLTPTDSTKELIVPQI